MGSPLAIRWYDAVSAFWINDQRTRPRLYVVVAFKIAFTGDGLTGHGCVVNAEPWARELGCSVRTVQRHKEMLVADGWLIQTVKSTYGGPGRRGRRARFDLTFPGESHDTTTPDDVHRLDTESDDKTTPSRVIRQDSSRVTSEPESGDIDAGVAGHDYPGKWRGAASVGPASVGRSSSVGQSTEGTGETSATAYDDDDRSSINDSRSTDDAGRLRRRHGGAIASDDPQVAELLTQVRAEIGARPPGDPDEDPT